VSAHETDTRSAAPHAPLVFTLDLEDHRASAAQPLRYPDVTRRVLDFLAARAVRGTLFVEGRVARARPGLVRDAAAAGHEIACHSLDHTPLTQQSPAQFRGATARCKALLEDVCGRTVIGYRAPVFSLTARTAWAPRVLRELGFAYSSSVLPARNPLHGWPGAPRHPFRWPCGLIELPVPVVRIGPLSLPFLGGIYLRYLPVALSLRLLRSGARGPAPWIYCHPYDFDPHEPWGRIRDASWATSALLWVNRRRTFAKLEALLRRTGPHRPFTHLLDAGAFAHLPVFEPGVAAPVA